MIQSRDPVVVNKILEGLKIPQNCSMPVLLKAAAKNRKPMLVIKELIRDYQIFKNE